MYNVAVNDRVHYHLHEESPILDRIWQSAIYINDYTLLCTSIIFLLTTEYNKT